ncbi:MAG: hypothetical protein GC162_16545 [Planctomycetes bacterium]|nr:hypothetical protein [Planctomycetota bacterium]
MPIQGVGPENQGRERADMALPTDKLEQAELLLGELERVEVQLRQLQEGLTRSHRLATLGTMASIIAHEFNNILTPMISYCQMAEQVPEDIPMLRKAVAKALAGAQKAASISSSMLGFARESDEAALSNIVQVIDEVFNCMARPPQRDGIRLTIDVDADLHVAISPVNLQQVLLNIVLNARQAMRRQGGSLALSAGREGETVFIEVADTGPGIPTDILPRVFEPFVTRREGVGAGQAPGTGLGLAICRDLIRRAGGQIAITKSDPTGTTFRIVLPHAEAPTPADTSSKASHSAA